MIDGRNPFVTEVWKDYTFNVKYLKIKQLCGYSIHQLVEKW